MPCHRNLRNLLERNKLRKVFNSITNGPSIYAADIKLATVLWVYCIQQHKFSDVIAMKIKKKHCLKHQFGLEFDDLKYSDVMEDF